MIGDNPATDGAGAKAFGVPFVLAGGRSEVSFEDLAARSPSGLLRRPRTV